MTNFSGEPISSKTANTACGDPQGGGMDSRRNGVAEVSPKYLAEVASNAIRSGYKQTEVGVIPEDWSLVKLEKLTSLIIDGTHHTPTYTSFGIPFLRVTDIQGELDEADFKFISEAEHASLIKRCKPEKGDLLLSKNGTIGIPRIVTWDWDFSVFVSLALIKLKKNLLEVEYLEQFFKSDFLNLQLAQRAKQGTVTNLHLEEIRELLIPIPVYKKEQTAIANALSDVDALISGLEKLIAKKQAIKTATMQQLLTGRTRLPQFALREDGTQKGTKHSELGEIPEDWEVVAMGDLGSTYGGLSGKSKQDFGHGNSLYVPFTNVMANVVVDVDNLEKVDVREAQNNLALGDLLFNGSSETPEEVCFSALVSADIRKLYLNSFCFGFRSNQKNAYLPLYLAYWFRSEVGRAAVLVMAQGSTRYNISKSQFMKLTIVLPDTEEQTAIATILSDMDAEIEVLEQRLGKTRQIKQGMMQELLTGKTRLVQPKVQ